VNEINKMINPRIVFMGSPAFALPTLQQLVRKYNQSIVGVVTQPDRPAGRGRFLEPSPVKKFATSLDLPIYQPEKLKIKGALDPIFRWNPELVIVVAYGQILPPELLAYPKYGCINLHASLLPRWRGASPIQAAILAGDEKTGVTIMKMDSKLDNGPVVAQRDLMIGSQDDSQTISEKLSILGADLLINILQEYLAGEIQIQPQNIDQVTYARLVKKEDGLLDFNQSAIELERKVRAFTPWPGTYFVWKSRTIKVIEAHVIMNQKFRPSQKGIIGDNPIIGTKQDCLVLDIVQPEGKKPMQGRDFLRGIIDWS